MTVDLDLIDWAAGLVKWLIALSALTCTYFLGRLRERLAQRRAAVRAAYDRELAEHLSALVPSRRVGES